MHTPRQTHGSDFIYIFPISGKLSSDDIAKRKTYTGAKACAFHGKYDELVSFSSDQKAFDLLQKNRVNIVFTEFDGGYDGIFTSMKTKITNIVQKYMVKIAN